MAVKEIKLAEIDFSRSTRTKVTFSRTQDLDWAEEGVFTVYLDVQHENGEAEVIELGLTSDYVDYANYVNQSGQTTLDVLVTVRLFNDDDGGVGLFGDSTEALNRTVCILSAATDKYIKSDFVGFDKENLTADDLELELKKRDLGELYLNNRESRVRASTDHTLSNLPLNLSSPSSEPEDVAASRRRIAEAIVREGEVFIDNTPVALVTTDADGNEVNDESETTAASRRALAQAIDDATVSITVNIPERAGVDTPGTFKLKLSSLHSADVALEDDNTFILSGYNISTLDDNEVIWLGVGKQTATAHPEGRLVPVSVAELRGLEPLVATNTTTGNSAKSTIIRDVVANGISLFLARTSDFELLVATSDAAHDLLPLTIYGLVADGVVTVEVGTTGNIEAITYGIPGTDVPASSGQGSLESTDSAGHVDRILWVRNQNRVTASDGERDITRDRSFTTPSTTQYPAPSYFGGQIESVDYLWKPDPTNTSRLNCFTMADDVAYPIYDITTSNANTFSATLISQFKGGIIARDPETGAYKIVISMRDRIHIFDVNLGVGVVEDTTSAVAVGLLARAFINIGDRGGISFSYGNYLYEFVRSDFTNALAVKRYQIFGLNASGAVDALFSLTLNTTITAPTGKSVATGAIASVKQMGEYIYVITGASDTANHLTIGYNLSTIELGGAVSPAKLVDFTSVSKGSTYQVVLSNQIDVMLFENPTNGSSKLTANNLTLLSALYFGPLVVVDTTYHGVSITDLISNLSAIVAGAVENAQFELTNNPIIADAPTSLDSANQAPTRRAVGQAIIDSLSNLSVDAVIDVADGSLPPIIQETNLPPDITTNDDVHYNGIYYGPSNAADAPDNAVAYDANAVAIDEGEIYVKELITLGMYHEEHVEWREYADPVVPGVNTSGGQYIGAFRTEADLPASRADHDYWYDYGDHHWYIQFSNSSEYVDEDGNPDPGVDPVYVLWTSGPNANNAASPFNPGEPNSFPGTWEREVNSREAASRRVRGNDQLFFFDSKVYTSYNYVNADAPFFVYVWKKLSDLDAGDIIPYLDGALGGDEWRSGLTSEALMELTDRVTANELELDALDGVVADLDRQEEIINTMSSGDPQQALTVKEKLDVDMSNAEASRIRTQHLADEAKYGRGQFIIGRTYESGQSVTHLGVLYWAIGRIANAQLTPDVDTARWTTTEETRVNNAFSFEGIPLHADEIIYVDIGPRIDGITDDYFVAGSETTNHTIVGKVYNIPASSNEAFSEVGSFLATPPTTSLKQFEGLCHHIARIDVDGAPTIYEYVFSPYAEYNADGTGSFRVHGMIKVGDAFTIAGVDQGIATPYSSYNPTRQSSVMGIDIISVAADEESFVVGTLSSNSLDGDGFAQVKLFTQTFTMTSGTGHLFVGGQTEQVLDIPPSFIVQSMASPAPGIVSIVGVDSLAIDAVYEIRSFNAADGSVNHEYGAIINSVRPVMSGHDHTDYITGFHC